MDLSIYQPVTILHSHVNCQIAPLSNTLFHTLCRTEEVVIENAEGEHDDVATNCVIHSKEKEDFQLFFQKILRIQYHTESSLESLFLVSGIKEPQENFKGEVDI